eukprot:6197022-Pleurochrysis_carterae.AAC.2
MQRGVGKRAAVSRSSGSTRSPQDLVRPSPRRRIDASWHLPSGWSRPGTGAQHISAGCSALDIPQSHAEDLSKRPAFARAAQHVGVAQPRAFDLHTGLEITRVLSESLLRCFEIQNSAWPCPSSGDQLTHSLLYAAATD